MSRVRVSDARYERALTHQEMARILNQNLVRLELLMDPLFDPGVLPEKLRGDAKCRPGVLVQINNNGTATAADSSLGIAASAVVLSVDANQMATVAPLARINVALGGTPTSNRAPLWLGNNGIITRNQPTGSIAQLVGYEWSYNGTTGLSECLIFPGISSLSTIWSGLLQPLTTSTPLNGGPYDGSAAVTFGLDIPLITTYGGTGLASWTQGDIPYYTSGTLLSKLAKDTNATRYISNTGTNNAPAWAQVSLTSGVSGVLPIANGGSNKALTLAAGAVLWTDADSFEVSGVGSSGQPLVSGGTTTPTWRPYTIPATVAQGDILYASGTTAIVALSKDTNSTRYLSNTGTTNNPAWAQVALTTGVSGVLPIANGGTNKALTLAAGAVVWTDADSFEVTAAGSAGQLLTSTGTTAPAWTTATFPGTAGATGTILQSNGTNWIASTPTWPTAASTAGKVVISDGTNLVMSTPTFPNASATSGKFIRSDGTNWIASTPTLPTSAGTAGKVLRSDGTNYVESTPTFPNTGTTGKVIIGNGTNYVESTPTYPNASPSSGTYLRGDGTNFITSTELLPNSSTAGDEVFSTAANTIGMMRASAVSDLSMTVYVPMEATTFINTIDGTAATVTNTVTSTSVVDTAAYPHTSIGNCGTADGDDYLSYGSNYHVGTSDWSFAIWFKSSQSASKQFVVADFSGGANGWCINWNAVSGKFNVALGTSLQINTTIGTGGWLDGNWHFGVWSFTRAGNCVQYIDGIQDGTLDISARSADNLTGGTYRLFNRSDATTGEMWNGSLDEAMQWTVALTAAQVRALYLQRTRFIPQREIPYIDLANTFTAANTFNSTLTVAGATTLNGAVTLGDASGDDLAANGRWTTALTPKTNNNVALGTAALQWSDVQTALLSCAGLSSFGGTLTVNAQLNVVTGVAANYAFPGGMYKVSTTAVGNVGGGTDDLITFSVPGGSLGSTNQSLMFDVGGTFAANGNTKTVAVLFGGTTLVTSGAVGFNGGSWRATGQIFRTGAATQVAIATMTIVVAAGTTTILQTYSTPAETLSGAITFKCTGLSGSSATDDIIQKYEKVWWHPAYA